jgi:hypothetical protein
VSPEPICRHLDGVYPAPARGRGCEDCLAIGQRWLHLRRCLHCGHAGCCDQSPGRHASGHAREAGHPVVESMEPNEDWRWCFVDEVYLQG